MPRGPGQEVFSLYGDPAYPQSLYLFGADRNAVAGTEAAAFNRDMSKVRESVEWGDKQIISQWKFLNFQECMKVYKFPVARYYMIGGFLTNLQCCFYGNQIASYFEAKAVSIEDYLNLVD